MSRALRPRDPIVIAAVLVSQENCLAVIGVNPQRYLEKIVPLCAGHVAELGKLRIIPVAVVLDAVRRLASMRTNDAAIDVEIADEHTTDSLLASVGMRRTA